jgi:hypothetical protein
MVNNPAKSLITPSPEDLKRVFEACVSGALATRGADRMYYRTPISQRSASPDAEKRALSDAARALAQLWKISPHPAR